MASIVAKKENKTKYCAINDCKEPWTHNILSHYCEKCKDYCHKEVDTELIVSIPRFLKCDIPGCLHRDTHTNEGHRCRACGWYGHSYQQCNYQHLSIKNLMEYYEDKCDNSYIVTCGMGGHTFCRTKTGESFETLHVEPCNWGQYGPDSRNDIMKVYKFLKGYTPLREIDTFEIIINE